MEQRNLYLYWVGEEYTLITILRNLIYLHSTNGVGYKIHLINEKNIKDYVTIDTNFHLKEYRHLLIQNSQIFYREYFN